MAKVTYKNSRNGDTVTIDTSTADGKNSEKRVKALDNWSKVDTPDEGKRPEPARKPPANAGRAKLLEYALAHASDEEKNALEQMTDEQLRAFVDGVGTGAGRAAGV